MCVKKSTFLSIKSLWISRSKKKSFTNLSTQQVQHQLTCQFWHPLQRKSQLGQFFKSRLIILKNKERVLGPHIYTSTIQDVETSKNDKNRVINLWYRYVIIRYVKDIIWWFTITKETTQSGAIVQKIENGSKTSKRKLPAYF